MRDKIDELYDALKADGAVSKSREHFRSRMLAPGKEGYNNRKQLYDALKADGAVTSNSYEEFAGKLGIHAVKRGGVNNATNGTGMSMLPADVEERRIRTARPPKPLNKSKARQRLMQQQQAIERQQQRWQQQGERLKEYTGKALESAPGKMENRLRPGAQEPRSLGTRPEIVRGNDTYNPETGKFEAKYMTPDGDYSSRAGAEAVLYRNEHPMEDELQQAYLERERLQEEMRNVDSGTHRFNIGSMSAGMPSAYGTYAAAFNSPEFSMLSTAYHQNEERIKALERERDNNGFWTTLGKDLFSLDTWDFGASEFMDAGNLLQYGMRDDLNEKESAARRAMLDNVMANNAAKQQYGDNDTFMQRAADLTANALPFVAQFLATGGMSSLTEGGAKLGAKAATRWATGKVGEWILKNTGVLAGDLAGALVMANTVGILNTGADIMGRHQGQLMMGEDGSYYFTDGKSWGRSIYEGETAQTLEYYTEMLGNHLGAISEWIKAGAGKIAGDIAMRPGGKLALGVLEEMGDKMGLSRMSELFSRITGSEWHAVTNNLLKRGGIQDYPSEVIEEEMNLILNSALVGDNKFSDLWDEKTQKDIIGGMALSIGFMQSPGVIGGTVQTAQYFRFKHKTDAADSMARVRLGADRWDNIKNQLDNASNADIMNVMGRVFNEENMTEQDKRATWAYVNNLLQMRGYNLRTTAEAKSQLQKGDQEQGTQEQSGAQYADGYNTVDEAGMQEAKARVDAARAALEEIVDEEVLASFDADPMAALREMADDEQWEEPWSDEEKAVALEWVNAQSAYDGMIQRVRDDIDTERAIAGQQIDDRTNPATGALHKVTMKDGRTGYVISGQVQMLTDGSMVDLENSDKNIIIIDEATGERSFETSDKIAAADDPVMAEPLKARTLEEITQTKAREAADKIDGNTRLRAAEERLRAMGYTDADLARLQADGAEAEWLQDRTDDEKIAAEEYLGALAEKAAEQQPVQSAGTGNQAAAEQGNAAAPAGEAPFEMPLDDEGEPIWEEATPEQGYAYLKSGELADEDVDSIIATNLAKAMTALDEARKQGKKNALERARRSVRYWETVDNLRQAEKGEAAAPAPVAENEMQPVEETAAQQQPTEQAATEPAAEEPGEVKMQMGEEGTAEGEEAGIADADMGEWGDADPKMVDLINKVAQALGLKIRFMDMEGGDNGLFDQKTNTIYVNRKRASKERVAFVLGHEMTHGMQAIAEAAGLDTYKAFKRAAVSMFRAQKELEGYNWKQYVKSRIATYRDRLTKYYFDKYTEADMPEATALLMAKDAASNINRDYIYDEFAADIGGQIMDNPELAARLFEQETDAKSLSGIMDLLRRFLEFLGLHSYNDARWEDLADKFSKMYNSVVEARNNTEAESEEAPSPVESATAKKPVKFSVKEELDRMGLESDGRGDVRFSLRFMPDKEQEQQLIDGIMKQTGVTKTKAKRWLKSETSLARIIMGDPDTMDYEADDRYKAIKKNSDYPQGTVDFNNICRKRKGLTTVYSILQRENPDRIFTAMDLETIRQTMIEDGHDVACGLCFVEDRRQRLGEIAQDFIDKMKAGELKPEVQKILGDETYVPTIAELIEPVESQKLYEEHPDVFNAFVRHNNARGQQAGRLFEGYAEYKREILKWNDAKVKAVNDVGGLRIFSFSDFEAHHLLDIVQIIEDCAARGVKIQGYTKVPAFARAVRNTGLKLNRSLIPKGDGFEVVDGKKRLAYDTKEGIDINDPDFMDETDNPNVGNILVGINDSQIALAMLDPFVDYIIPFHSGLSLAIRKAKGIDGWKNYKMQQRDKDKSTGKASENGVNIYTDVLQAAEAEGKPITNKREFVEKFLEVCEERGLEPRFNQFLNKDADGKYLYTEGYHKFLIDFKLFDKNGNIVPQEVVRPVFDDAFNKEILDKYAEGTKVEEDYSGTIAKLRERLGLDGEVRFSFSNDVEEFDATRDRAVEETGIVMPGLAEKEVTIVNVPRHDFTGTGRDAINKAHKWAEDNLVKEHTAKKGTSEEFNYIIDEDAISKYLSSSSTLNSENLGVHLAVLTKLPNVIDNSIDAEIHPDYKKIDGVRKPENGVDDENLLVHRMYGAVRIDNNIYRVKTTMHEHRSEKNVPHDYRVTKIELIISGPSTDNALNSSTEKVEKSTISGANLLQGVEKSYDPGKKLLDESEKITENNQVNFSVGRDNEFADAVENEDEAQFSLAEGLDDGGVRFSVREKPAPKKTLPVYKLMRLGDDGKLYPLYIDGAVPIELGTWYDADSPNMEMLVNLPAGVHLINPETGEATSLEDYNKQRGITKKSKYPSAEAVNEATANGMRWVYIEPTKGGQRRFGGEARRYWNLGINGSGTVSTYSMRPGWHAGSLPTMRQIGKGPGRNLRDDRFVWVEGEISADVDYNEEAQGNPDNDIPTHIPVDGFYLKATNANAKASQADRVGWYISGAFKANRIMSDSEARDVIDAWNADPKHKDLQVEYDFPRESGKVFNAETMQLEEPSQSAGTGDRVRYSIEERTLMGMHNITEEKLRSALKLGGLANPSMAVINTEVGGFTNFGEISLIPSADLIASRTGGNAGTWGADAYSPRFPETHRRLGKGGDKKMRAWVKGLKMRQEMEYNTEDQFNDYYNGFNIRDNALVYPFLHEKGLSDEVDYYTHMNVDPRLEDDLREVNGDQWALLKRFDEDEEYKKKLTDIVVGDELKKINKKEGETFQEYRDRRREWAKEIRETLTEEDGYINRNLAEDLLWGQARAYRENGKFSESRTRDNAEQYIRDHGLEEEYKQYFEQKMQELGAELQVYAGSDSQGRSKYKPVSLEQVSKQMKKQGRAGGEGGIFADSPGAIRAKLLTPMKTLDQIRAKKDRLVSHEAFEQFRERYQEDLREYADVYARGSMGALADIITSSNMAATAKQYNIDLDSDAVAELNKFKNRVRALPTEYFETKFERPVMLDEFKKAVVPDDLPDDLRKALEDAGLDVVEYKHGDNADRERVTLDAVKNDDSIRFSIQGLDGYTEQDVLDGVRGDIEAKLEEAGVDDVTIKGMALHGSRLRGDARDDSDLDVVMEYDGDWSEDALFDLLNEEPVYFDGIKVDINPITRGKSGTLEQYMERSRRYDEEKIRANSAQYNDNAEARFSISPEEQERQIHSENFKKWFGDWENDPEHASKVVDEKGRPLVVYHQTNAKRWINRETGEDWEKLDWKKKQEWENKSQEEWEDAWEEQDFYEFDDRYARQSIEMPAIFFSPNNDPYHEYGQRTIAAYLDIKNPAINPDIPNRGVTDTAGRDAMEALKAQGYDGFIRTDEDGNILEYGVFDSNQVKSATENNGDFSRENPDIRFSLSVEDANRYVETFNDRYGIPEEFAELHAVDSEETVERIIDGLGLNDDDANDLSNDFRNKKLDGTALKSSNLVFIFTDRVRDEGELVNTCFHEVTHHAYKQLSQEEIKSYNNALMLWYRAKPNRNEYLEKEIFAKYDSEDWATEAMSHFMGALAETFGWDRIISGKPIYKEQGIINFVARIVNIITDGQPREEKKYSSDLSEETGSDEPGRPGGREGGDSGEVRFSVGDGSTRDIAIARDTYERMLKRSGFQFQEAVQDSMLSLKRLYQAVLGRKTRIEDVPENENAYLAENHMSSINAAEQHEYFTKLMKPLLAAIHDLAGKSEKEREKLINYMLAKHGLERNQVLADRDAQETAAAGGDYQQAYQENREKDYSGLTALTGESDVAAAEASAQQMVDDYERDHDTTELWRRVKAATGATLYKMYSSGLMSKATYDKTVQMFDYYIPLRGWDETTSDEVYGYLTDKSGPLGSPMKRAEGRTSVADDPIATIALMADDTIRAGNRNLMKQRFLIFAQNHPSDLVSVNRLWLQHNEVTDEWEPVFADIEANDTPEQVAQKVEAFEAKMEQLAQSEPDKYKRGRDAVNIPYKVVMNNLAEHQVLVKRGGETFVLTINGNPRAAQALNGMTNPDVKIDKGIVRGLYDTANRINRELSAFYTTRNPDFIMSNFLRDTLYSNCMTWVKESPNYALKFHKNFGRFNPAMLLRLFQKWENGTLDMNNPTEQMFYQFMINGGETGYTNVKDIEGHKRTIAKELRRQGSPVRKGLYLLGEEFDVLNRAVENCARFAAFVTSREMGRSIGRSVHDAKEVSVNFNKKGAGDKLMNANGENFWGKVGSFISGSGRLFYIFWNAGVQGMTNFGRAFKRHPVKATAGAASMYMLGVGVSLLAQAMGGDDEDDKDYYYNLPENVRRSNICFRIGNGPWVTIPLPIEFRAVYGLGEMAVGVATGKERYSDSELAYNIISQLSQLMPLDLTEGEGGWANLLPQVAKTPAELMTNRTWYGMPIYKDTPFNEDMPEWTKAYSSANQTIVAVTKWLNEVSGGNDYKKGKINLNPAMIEYALKSYFGGVTTTIDHLMKSASAAMGEGEFNWRDVPLASRVLRHGDERTAFRKAKNEYFNFKAEAEETKRLLNAYQKDTSDPVKYAELLSMLHYSPEYGRYLVFEAYNERVEDLRKAIKEGKADPDAEQLENEAIRDLVDAMHNYDNSKLGKAIARKDKDALKNAFDEDSVMRKVAAKEIAKEAGGTDSYGSPKTEYGEVYLRKRDYADLADDILLQTEMKKAKEAGDEDRAKAIDRARRELTSIKKGKHTKTMDVPGLGEGHDDEVMQRLRDRRRELMHELGITR